MQTINKIIIVLAVAFLFVLIWPNITLAASIPPLGTAASFSVLAGLSMSAAAPGTTISGDLGLSPGLAISRTGNWILGIDSTEYFGTTPSLSATAQIDALAAYNNLAGQDSDGPWGTSPWSPTPGVYTVASDVTFTGTITLNGDYDDIWVFQVGRDMTFSGSVVLTGNAQPCHVFWKIGRSATIASGSHFVGTLIASTGSVTLVSGATVNGRILVLNASLTTDGNTISGPTCNVAPTPAPTCTVSTSPNPVDYNGTSVITWSSTNATTCTASGGSTGWTGVSGSSGNWTSGALTLSSTYSMTCTGPGGTSPQCNVAVTVDPAPTPATLHVIKHVINNSGGSTLAPGFSVHVKDGAGDVAGSPASPQAGAEDPGTTYTLDAGTYTVSENTNTSYVRTFSDDCNAITGIITLAPGDNKTCTITNDDIVPAPPVSKITVAKIVIGGSRLPDYFHLFVDGAPVVRDVANIFSVGAHVVSENVDPNYTPTFALDCLSGSVNLIAGDNKTCIITNTYRIPLSSSGYSPPPVPPLIDVVKIPSPLALPVGPGKVDYTYTLRNIGTVPVASVTMIDDFCSPATLISGDGNGNARLDLNETWTYTCSTTLVATHTNTVIATGWAGGVSAIDIASATVVVGAPIVPPLIHVTKIPSPLTLPAGGGIVTYTYTVTNPGTVPLSNVTITDDKCTGLPGRVIGHPGDINKNNLLESNESWIFTCTSKLTETTTNTATASGEANGLTAKDYAIATVVVAAPVVPELPNAGYFFEDNTTPWIIAILIGLLILITVSVALILRKRTI